MPIIHAPTRAFAGRLFRGSALLLATLCSPGCRLTDPPIVATQLAFTVEPGTTTSNRQITPAVKVSAVDGSGNVATNYTGNVTVVLTAGSGTAGATLIGTTSVAAVKGVAMFSTLAVDKPGDGYTLTATTSDLSGATSSAFSITPGAAVRLAFTVQPTTTPVGVPITPAVAVSAQDGFGNLVPSFAGVVTVTLGTNPAGGTLSGTASVTAVNGVATFSTLSINKNGTAYAFSAAAAGLNGASSTSFGITGSGAATQLVFTVQPTPTIADHQITPAVKLTVEDAAGNVVTSFAGSIAVAITPGTGSNGAVLGGATTATAVNGVATFGTLFINMSGTGYTLTGTTSGLAAATSTPFDIVPGPVSRLAFTVQPTTTPVGAPITPAVQVSGQDSYGNLVPSFVGTVTVALQSNPAGGTLSGTTAVTAVSGVATFTTLSLNKSGTGYALNAQSPGIPAVSSVDFSVTGGPATQLAFTVQPTSTLSAHAISPAVRVTAEDATGNIATSFTGNVTVALGANPGGGPLLGTLTVAAVNGVASFVNLSINTTATGYTLTAAAAGLTGTTSTSFDILLGPATHLQSVVDPITTTAGATLGQPSVQVAAQDAGGNTVTSFAGSVTVAITAGTGTSGATLSGTTTVTATNGVATFSDLSIDKVGTGYSLTFTAGGLTARISKAFNITPGAATQLVFTVQPTTTAAGAMIAPAVQVSAEDALGNVATAFVGNLTVAITTGTGTAGAVLGGTTTVALVSGVASFGNLTIDRVGTGYTLTATAAGLTAGTSAGFTIQ
jgi:hypothetical protein